MEWLEELSGKISMNYDSSDSGVMVSWISGCLIAHSVERGLPLYAASAGGKPTVELEKLLEIVCKYGEKFYVSEKTDDKRFSYILISKNGVLNISNNGYEGDKVSASILTRSKEEVAAFEADISKKLTEISEGEIYVITKGPKGPRLESIGVANSPLERGNYEDNVIKAYDYIIKDLKNKKNPGGRLSIIDGPAGTGKTHLIRGIMNETDACIFVIVQPEHVVELSGPSLVPLLNETKQFTAKSDKKSIVIILEDADDILVPRGRDNMSAISALLNYTAGIFGDLFDLRVIATTNAKKIDFEKALLRSGRLSRAVTVRELSAPKATEVYHRLGGDKTFTYEKPQTLADVYAHAKGVESQEPAEEETLGFKQK